MVPLLPLRRGADVLDDVLDPHVEEERPLVLTDLDEPLLERVVLGVGDVVLADHLVDALEHLGGQLACHVWDLQRLALLAERGGGVGAESAARGLQGRLLLLACSVAGFLVDGHVMHSFVCGIGWCCWCGAGRRWPTGSAVRAVALELVVVDLQLEPGTGGGRPGCHR